MRLGIRLASSNVAPLDDLAEQARVAEEVGLDFVWLTQDEDAPALAAPLVTACALAPRTSSIRLAVEVTAGRHPVGIAEDAFVADLASGGRLVLVLSSDHEDLLAETADVLLAAIAARPFSHHGARWQIPGRLPENDDVEDRIRITPPPAQLELPVWLTGAAAASVGTERCLSFVAPSVGDPATRGRWDEAQQRLGRAAARVRRPAHVAVATDGCGGIDHEAIIEQLLAARATWGLDVAVLELRPDLPLAMRTEAIANLASFVRPRVQMDEIPAHLLAHWASLRPSVTP